MSLVHRSASRRCGLLAGCAVLLLTMAPTTAKAQVGAVGGVYVDPRGMLRETSSLDKGQLRDLLRQASDAAQPSRDAATKSPLRKVSLARLEQEARRRARADEPLSSDMAYLAGLTSLRYVFFYPETHDVVLAGPAEGWELLETGEVAGKQSRRPVLQLDDLIVALRYAFAPEADGFLGCSIEPTQTGIKAHAAFVRRLAGFDRTQLPQVLEGMEQAMGPQDVKIYGVPGSTRFALEMIAADYRLKRLALAHDPSPSPKVPSYLDLAEKTVTGGPQRQHRWWFVGACDAIRHTADRSAFEFDGVGLKVDTAPTQMKGGDPHEPKPSRPARQFAELATKNMPELVEKVPVFAELANLVSLAVAAEVIRSGAGVLGEGAEENDQPLADSEGDSAPEADIRQRWRPAYFLDEEACPVAQFETPKQTPSLANARFVKEQFWLFSTSGGVEIDPRRLVDEKHLKPASGAALGNARAASRPGAGGRWWWD